MSCNHFKVLLKREDRLLNNHSIFNGLLFLFREKFMYLTEPSVSDIIIKGYCIDNKIYIDVHQNHPIYNDIEEFMIELGDVIDFSSYVEGFQDKEHCFFEEFQISYSSLEHIENGKNIIINLIKSLYHYITDEEKSFKSFIVFNSFYKIICNGEFTDSDFENLLISFKKLLSDLNSDSNFSLCYRGNFDRIHTDKYSAQEHFKEFVKSINLRLKPLGFKKKGNRFTLCDKELGIDRVIWMQKMRGLTKSELMFTINFYIDDINKPGYYMDHRFGFVLPPYKDKWIDVNIHIDTEKSIQVMNLHLDKVLEILMSVDDNDSIKNSYITHNFYIT